MQDEDLRLHTTNLDWRRPLWVREVRQEEEAERQRARALKEQQQQSASASVAPVPNIINNSANVTSEVNEGTSIVVDNVDNDTSMVEDHPTLDDNPTIEDHAIQLALGRASITEATEERR